jgi:nucleoside-diphosphate-sugar epimerase
MKVFLAGAGGLIGRRLIPLLREEGHDVVAMTGTASKAGALAGLGATPVVADGLDRPAVLKAVADSRPEIVIHEMTALSGRVNSLKRFDEEFALTNRLRTEGTDHLLDAALAAGARRFVAQSFAGWTYERSGTGMKSEEAPFDPAPPSQQRQSLGAIRYLESRVTAAEGLEGIVLRYGLFYGPGTRLGYDEGFALLVRNRRFPIIGDGAGVWSFIHIDDAARATVLAVERGKPGIYNIVDDRPAPVADWLPELSRVLGAKPPRRVPVWLGRLAAGEVAVSMMTQMRGASNAKAKRQLGWAPKYASYREGFRDGLRADSATVASTP